MRLFLRAAALAVILSALAPSVRAMTLPQTASPEQVKLIEAALPETAPAKPRQPRRLLIFDLNVDYGGHGSIPVANTAFTLMGQKTGAFETVLSRDPAVFAADSLKQFDAVFFNNTVGNCFEDPQLRENLLEFVLGGGGLMGCHGTTVGFTRWTEGAKDDWPEFGRMIGGRGANHRTQDEPLIIHNEDPGHPVSANLGPEFQYASEFFRVGEPYSRNRVRVLLSIDNAKSAKLQDVEALPKMRPDDDYAIAWIRNYGQGRTFYSTIAHNPEIFWDPQMLKFYLAAAQFALGDLDASTIPSARLTPALRAQEQLGWRLGVEAYTFHKYTFFETIDRSRDLGLAYIGGLNFQKVSDTIPKNLDPSALTDEEIQQIRYRLDDAGVRLLTYFYQTIPGDEAACRKVFEFGRKLGIETFLAEPKLEDLPLIDRMCNEYHIKVALHNHGPDASPNTWSPEAVLKTCEGLSPMIGACADVGYWMRAGIDPIEGVRTLGQRLITIQMHDLDTRAAEGHDVPWGTGVGQTEQLILEMHKLGIKPVMYGLEYSYDWFDSMPEITETFKFFNDLSMKTVGVKP